MHDKAIVYLQADEAERLLYEIESGKKLTQSEQAHHDIYGTRDLAIVTLLLYTGVRVSECVGIDIGDIDFNINSVKVMRKGGNESIIYFGEEVKNALERYLWDRKKIKTQRGHENALFLSREKRRITPKAIQVLVNKYSEIVTPYKKISPHKLRSTCGTQLYKKTGDIYLVADVLGH